MSNDEALRMHWGNFVSKRAIAIESIMEEAKNAGATFKNISQCAQYTAYKLSQLNPNHPPVNRSTLTRSKTYKRILGNFVDGNRLLELKPSERLKFELDIRRKRLEIDSLKEKLSVAFEERSKLEFRISQSLDHDRNEIMIRNSFIIWKNVLHTLLLQLEGAHFDLIKRTVEDPNGVGILLEEKDFPDGFFNWLAKTES